MRSMMFGRSLWFGQFARQHAGDGGSGGGGSNGSAGDSGGSGSGGGTGDAGGGSGGSHRSAAELEADLKRAISVRDNAKRELATLRGELDTLRKADAERKAKEAEDAKRREESELRDSGRVDELLTRQKTEYEQKLSDQKKRFMSVVEREVRDSRIRAAVASLPGIAAGAAEDITALLASRVGVNAETLAVSVLAPDGKSPAVGDDGKPLTVESLIASFVKDKPYFLANRVVSTPAASGSSASAAGTFGDFKRALADPAYFEQWQKADPAGCKRAEDEHFARM